MSADDKHDPHPTTGTYLAIAAILTAITMLEVGVFYVPAFQAVLAPMLILMSAGKFLLVVLFYMHLKVDSRLFTFIFVPPFLLAGAVIMAMMFLFGAWWFR